MGETLSYTAKPETQLLWEWKKERKLKLSLKIRMYEDAAVVSCKGRIVYRREVSALSCAIDNLLPQARRIVLELSEVENIDGAGLGELLAMRARARAHSCTIAFANLSEHVRELLELTRVAFAFEIYPTVDDALLAAHAHAV